jgi:hypothetical protein
VSTALQTWRSRPPSSPAARNARDSPGLTLKYRSAPRYAQSASHPIRLAAPGSSCPPVCSVSTNRLPNIFASSRSSTAFCENPCRLTISNAARVDANRRVSRIDAASFDAGLAGST